MRSRSGSASCGARTSASPLWKHVRSPVWHAGPAGSTSASSASPSQSRRIALTAWVLPDVAPLRHSSAREESDERVDEEAADVLYHLGVLLHSRGRSLRDAEEVLLGRRR